MITSQSQTTDSRLVQKSNITPPRVDASALLGNSRTLLITHGDSEYRLQLTRNQKLILTK